MKTGKVSFDFSNNLELLQLLRTRAAQKGLTQKAIVEEALQRYFSQEQDDQFLRSAADKVFSEWSNPDDDVYNSL